MDREQLGKAQRRLATVLEREWDPIGVYMERAEEAPPGEYNTYADWIVAALASDADVDGVIECLQRARERMGLEAPQDVDGPIAARLVDEWDRLTT